MTRTSPPLLAALMLTACAGTKATEPVPETTGTPDPTVVEPAPAPPKPTPPATPTVTSPEAPDPTPATVLCGSRTRYGCEADQFCAWTNVTCDMADRPGTCQPFPADCGPKDPPVCTCGGLTRYANVCEARAAGVRKLALTACLQR